MTKREWEDYHRMRDALVAAGFTRDEADALRRISLTLRRWSEHECNGTIQRDGENSDGAPYWYNTATGKKYGRVPDRERGALARLAQIVTTANMRRVAQAPSDAEWRPLTYYVQGDPRGCALYILRPGDVPDGADPASCYTRGIAVG